MLVGGAALSQKFTDQRIAPAYGGLAVYAVDAMRGLALADRILSGERRASGSRPRPTAGARAARRRRPCSRRRARSRRRRCAARSRDRGRAPRARPRRARPLGARPSRRLAVRQPAHALRQAPRPAGQLPQAEGGGRPEARGARRGHRKDRARRLDPRARDVPLLRRVSDGNSVRLSLDGKERGRAPLSPAGGGRAAVARRFRASRLGRRSTGQRRRFSSRPRARASARGRKT